MKTLITGISGFLADELISRFDDKSQIRGLSRNEGQLIKVKQRYPDIEIMTGDISDQCVCEKACQDVDQLFHLAAFKHVGLAEDQPYQCTLSNVQGTLNLLRAFSGSLFLNVSTDKAVQVKGVYGATKMLTERLLMEWHNDMQDYTKYRQVRYGNVLYSTGSVLCKWKELIQAGKPITITDPEATRFFWTREQAVDHIFEAIEMQTDATPYIPEMKAMRMDNLFIAMCMKYGDVPANTIGLQPGENMHETLDGITFSNEVEQYTISEIMELI